MKDGRSLQTRLYTYEYPTSSHQDIHLHVDFAWGFFFFFFFLREWKGELSAHDIDDGLRKIPI